MRTTLLATGFAIFSAPALAAGFTVTTPDFSNGGTIPAPLVLNAEGCTGGNHSPTLSWSGAPPATQSFAVTMFDPDAPTRTGWWHWTVFNIPADVHGLPADAGAADGTLLPPGAAQGRNDFGFSGYGGPCPPIDAGPHHYVITVYALKVAHLPLEADASGTKVGVMLRSNALATARTVGLYGRTR